MSIEKLEGYLFAFDTLNADYKLIQSSIKKLPESDSMENAMSIHLDSLCKYDKTWSDLKIASMGKLWRYDLQAIVKEWQFCEQFKCVKDYETISYECRDALLDLIEDCIDVQEVFEVKVTTNAYKGVFWQEFIFESTDGYWLLTFELII